MKLYAAQPGNGKTWKKKKKRERRSPETVTARASWAWTLDADWNAGGWNVE